MLVVAWLVGGLVSGLAGVHRSWLADDLTAEAAHLALLLVVAVVA